MKDCRHASMYFTENACTICCTSCPAIWSAGTVVLGQAQLPTNCAITIETVKAAYNVNVSNGDLRARPRYYF